MTPSPQHSGLLSLLILVLTTARTARARPSDNRVQQPANHGLMTSTAPYGGVCNDTESDGVHNSTATRPAATPTTIIDRRKGEEEEGHKVRVPEGFFAAHGPKTAANPLCGRTVGVAWQGGRAGAVLVGYCDKCLGPVVGGVDVSPGLFAAAGGRADAGGTVEVDWWLEG